MSRLADRIRENCQPARVSLMNVFTQDAERLLREEIEKLPNVPTDPDKLERLVKRSIKESDPVSIEEFDVNALNGTPVFAADDVALYTFSLPRGEKFVDVVSSMAPPFEKFFVEFQKVPNECDLYSWGCLITAEDGTSGRIKYNGTDGQPRWFLQLDTFLEKEKGKPFGPVAHHIIGLAEDGTWFHHSEGSPFYAGWMCKMDKEPPPDVNKDWIDNIAQFLFPALLTISFLHCKNIEVRTVEPPEKLSRKYRKNTGRDLVKYHVLDIAPMRKILDRYRKGSSDDLRRALHICRGHFKTFTDDAPLMGRHVGTFWWTPQVRGSKDAGVVLKDYRVPAPVEFGKAYRDADENPPEASKEAPLAKDPDSAGRGQAAHSKTQNKIAEILSAMGHVPRSPSQNEPEYDLAWKAAETLFVCEVKSITPVNEERQLRMAIGQVIRYRQKIAAAGYEPVMAVIAAECQPKDSTWDELCVHEGILLVWPDVAEGRFKETEKRIIDAKVS